MFLRRDLSHLASSCRYSTLVLLATLTASIAPSIAAAEEEPAAPLPWLAAERDGKRYVLPLRRTDIEMRVSGFVASGEITQEYENFYREPIEVVYVFPLPRRAAVAGYTIHIGEREVAGEIREKEDAQREYEEARRAGHTAGLLEQHRTNVFEQKIANVPPGESIRVRISWHQPLDFDAGSFSLVVPSVVAPRYDSVRGTAPDSAFNDPPIVMPPDELDHELSLSVDIDAGMSISDIESPSHDLVGIDLGNRRARMSLPEWENTANRDFVLRWRVSEERPVLGAVVHSDERGGFFSLMLVPPIQPREGEPPPREIVFVVDVSGSMNGLALHLCKEAMTTALDGLRPVDTFEIVTFAGYATSLFGRSMPATSERIDEARRFVAGLRASGGTEMMDAVHAALGPDLESSRHRYVFFLTDGLLRNETQIMAAVREHTERHDSRERRARVFSFGVGSSVNRRTIDGIAEAGRGVAVYGTNREDPKEAVRRFYSLIDHPVLANLEIDWGGLPVMDESLIPGSLPELRMGRPLLIHGRYFASSKGRVRLRGYTDEGDLVELSLPLVLSDGSRENPALPRVWARARIEEITDRMWKEGRRIDSRTLGEVDREVTDLGLEFGLVTHRTSFVAVDRSRRVGRGSPLRIEQPIAPPEDMDPMMAGARPWQQGGPNHFLGTRGAGSGGGGSALGIGGLSGDRGIVAGMGGIGTRGRAGGLGGYGIDLGGRGRAVTQVISRVTEVDGEMDLEVAARIIRRHNNELRYCYERILQRNPSLAGSLVMRIVIGPDGSVESTEIVDEETTIADADVAACQRGRVQRWRFPEPRNRSLVKVRLEIEMQPRP